MTFEINERGDAQNITVLIKGTSPQENARESAVAAIIGKAATDISKALGGYVVVSAKGNVRQMADERYGGDNVILQVTTTLQPHPPVQDAGLEAAGGSPRNFPPESSTAAPQTADGSPSAAQEPQPQPIVPGQAPLEQQAAPGPIQAAAEGSPIAVDIGHAPVGGQPNFAPRPDLEVPAPDEAQLQPDPIQGSTEPESPSSSTLSEQEQNQAQSSFIGDGSPVEAVQEPQQDASESDPESSDPTPAGSSTDPSASTHDQSIPAQETSGPSLLETPSPTGGEAAISASSTDLGDV